MPNGPPIDPQEASRILVHHLNVRLARMAVEGDFVLCSAEAGALVNEIDRLRAALGRIAALYSPIIDDVWPGPSTPYGIAKAALSEPPGA